jgi:hypothetical protein
MILNIGKEMGKGIPYHFISDFNPDGRGIRLSKELGLYGQKY